MDTDESLYHAAPQTKGKIAHEKVDNKTSTHSKQDLISLPVYSVELKLMGKIDIYKGNEKLLIERKNNLKNIYQGQIYQLWAEYFCMTEMGYIIEKIAFYEITTKKFTYLELPSEQNLLELKSFIAKYFNYNPETSVISVNPNKCIHCIYCNLCDKTSTDNVYI